MMKQCRFLGLVLMVLSIGFAATSANAGEFENDRNFMGTVNDDYMEANNWRDATGVDGNIPDGDPVPECAAIGYAYYFPVQPVSCTLYSGDHISGLSELQIGQSTDTSFTIEAGASMEAVTVWAGYAGGGSATLTIDGTLEFNSFFNFGCRNTATLNMNGGTLNGTDTGDSKPGLLIGLEYAIGSTTPVHWEVNLTDAYLRTERAMYVQDLLGDSVFQMNGGTIDLPGAHPGTGYDYWQMGGVVEYTGEVLMDNVGGGGLAVFGSSNFVSGQPPVLKFSGAGAKLTVTGDVAFYTDWQFPGAPIRENDPVVLDVDGLVVVEGEWTTVMDIDGSISTKDGNLYFDPDSNAYADANWSLRVDAGGSGLVEVKYGDAGCIMGDINCSGYVDDNDLSILLANWQTGTIWAMGDLSGDETVNDNDLSLLLANWHAGVVPTGRAAIPEPATMALLALGGLSVIARKRR